MPKANFSKMGIALLYAVLSSIALNFFWLSGNIYANGITGLSQLLSVSLNQFAHIQLSIPFLVLIFNLPLLIIAWFKIDKEFTCYTIFAVVITSFVMKLIPPLVITTDPFICALFGGVLHGISVGITLNSDFSTGGLDIIGIIARKYTKQSIGSVFIVFNVLIEFAAGFLFGWQYAFYSAFSVFISGRVVDYVNAKQQKVQLLVVTQKAPQLVPNIQEKISRGMTIVNDVEGAFDHESRKMLIVVVSKRELAAVKTIITQTDQQAFISIASGVATNTSFFDW
ncbi:YitT family protein [Enterococcus sp. HY326]|uniref:YitT family protein n=1 Tax=Enterococcus sp. HY326 TaxID=2971265 RepID=UPI0022401D8A|nr:YitT family protein [Enterococcus sp. HY326]